MDLGQTNFLVSTSSFINLFSISPLPTILIRFRYNNTHNVKVRYSLTAVAQTT